MSNDKIFNMEFSKIYPLLVNKAIRKGRSQKEVDEIISWLTGYCKQNLDEMIAQNITYYTFFADAPRLNERRRLITGSVCGVKVQDVENPMMQEIRYLDKLIDELAKGRPMEKILR
ncbi:MAG: DUF2200 domain-containing protein [bacterium]|nr:DUF2200 domain-containing protein [bacterium]